MTQCVQSAAFSKRRNRWQDKRKRQLIKLANMRAAKECKRLARGPREGEPKMARWFPLEFGVRDKRNGDTTVWTDLKSTRDVAKRIAVLLKHYT